jgi:4-diphosphocytidyl-2-C-methyl-D-erythritol kinase
VARSLGADMPYFLEGGTALGLDRGDLVFPLIDAPAAWVVLVIPPFGVSTKEAYAWWDNARGHATRNARPAKQQRAGLGPDGGAKARSPVRPELGNDLQPAVVDRHPEIGRIIAALHRAGADHAAMSGSGSATFGLFSRRLAAERAARLVARGQRQVLVSRTLGRDAYQRLAGCRAMRTSKALQ